jgi:parallel beta-helix repeat protein
MEESMFSHAHYSPKNHHQLNRVSKPLNTLAAVFCIILIGMTSACGPTPEELSAFQTVTAMAAFTPTPQPSPTPAGITPDHDLTTILESAADGDVITLAPGVFNLTHGLNLDKNLTLIGAGDDQTTITTNTPYSDITTMLMYSGTGTLTFKGIKIEYAGSDPAAVIYMQSGSLWIEDCILTGATLSASGKQVGAISMANDAAAVIRNSQIAGSLNRIDLENPQKIPGGIFLSGTNKLNLEGSSITDSYIGVYAYGQAQITITGSQFSGNYSALTLLETATASISGSALSNCSGSCIVTADEAQVSISDNTFSESPDALAIQVTENSNAKILNNKMSDVKSAVIFMDSAAGEVTGNTIENFTNIGIFLQNTTAPMLTNNTLSLGADYFEEAVGISYQDSAAGEARGNQFTNLFLGISLVGDAAPLLDANTFEFCRTGIFYEENAGGTANANIIQNGDSGILINSPASPTITNNTIQANFDGLYSNPEDWIEKLNITGNNITDGPPEITIVTVTPAK